MAISTSMAPDGDIRIHRVTDRLDFDELRGVLATLYEDDAYRPDQHSLWDLRQADLTGFSVEQVGSIAGLVREAWGTGSARSALVVGGDDVNFGMARMYEQRLGAEPESKVRVFTEMEAALAWLRTPQPDPD